MLDEVILCSELPYRKEWCKNLLQIKYFGHSTGGTEFFNILSKVIESKSQAGWVFLLCLLLGFSGKYYMSNNNEIDDYISKLKQQCHLNTSKEVRQKSFNIIKTRGNHRILDLSTTSRHHCFLFCVIVCAVCEMISMYKRIFRVFFCAFVCLLVLSVS